MELALLQEQVLQEITGVIIALEECPLEGQLL